MLSKQPLMNLHGLTFKLIGAICGLLNFLTVYSQSIVLVNNQSSCYQIVIPYKATDVESQAAFQLQNILQRVSSCKMPIKRDNQKATSDCEILIGRTNRPESHASENVQQDGIVIKTVAKKLVLSGGNRKGTLYAVNTFLEDYLGCRMYGVGDLLIPSQRNIIIKEPIKRIENPAFSFRSTFFVESLNEDYADWHKINYFFEDYGTFAHTFNSLLPASLFSSHPEYFALVNGKRTIAQPCLSNREVLKIVVQNLKKQILEKPAAKTWSVSPNDNFDFCHCALCEPKHKRENGYMGTLLPFVISVATQIPERQISTLAYNQSFNAPNLRGVPDNVEIIVCLTGINNNRDLGISTDGSSQSIRANLQKWRGITKNLMLWDYTVCFPSAVSPFPNYFYLKRFLQYYQSLGIAKVFEQGIGNMKSEFSEMRCYLLSKLMWNPDQNQEAIMYDFIDHFYGPAKEDIKQYLKMVTTNAKNTNDDWLSPWENPIAHKATFLTQEKLNDYKLLFDRAEAKVKNQPLFLKRVVKERLAIDYAMLEIARNDVARAAYFGTKSNLEKKYRKFVEDCTKYGIDYLGEGGGNPPKTYASHSLTNYFKEMRQ